MTVQSRELTRRLAELVAGEDLPVIGKCPACRVHVRLELERDVDVAGVGRIRAALWLSSGAAWCIEHRLALRFAALRSEWRPGRPCSSSCTHASSATCRCACAGANHGIAA